MKSLLQTRIVAHDGNAADPKTSVESFMHADLPRPAAGLPAAPASQSAAKSDATERRLYYAALENFFATLRRCS